MDLSALLQGGITPSSKGFSHVCGYRDSSINLTYGRLPSDNVTSCESCEVADGNVLRKVAQAKDKFVSGVHQTHDRFFFFLTLYSRHALVPTFLIAGIPPFLAYYLISPAHGLRISRWMIKCILGMESLYKKTVYQPTAALHRMGLLLVRPMPTLAFVVPLLFVVATISPVTMLGVKRPVEEEIWSGGLHRLELSDELRNEVSNLFKQRQFQAAEFQTRFAPACSGPISVSVAKAIFLCRRMLLGPILEEAVYRGVFLGGSTWIFSRWNACLRCGKSKATKGGEASKESTFFGHKKTRIRPSGQKLAVWVTSIWFGLDHLSNNTKDLRLLTTTAVVRGNEMGFMISSFTTVYGVMTSVYCPFANYVRLYCPLYESVGLTASIGAHVMWNLMVNNLEFFLLFWILRVVVRFGFATDD